MFIFFLSNVLFFKTLSAQAKGLGLCISGMTTGQCGGSNSSALDVLARTASGGQGCIVLLGTNDALQAGKIFTSRVS